MAIPTYAVEKLAVFSFGITFLIAILVLVIHIPAPTPAQFFAFRLTMALSAAGIGALLPGFLRLSVPLPVQGGIRAGGALALFASVWFVNPATLGVDVQPPKEDARALIDHLLSLNDSRNHRAAYELFSLPNKERVSEKDYVDMGKEVRDPLGGVERRVLVGTSTPNELNGIHAPFVLHTYQTRFTDAQGVWAEVASTIPEGGTWRIFSYNIGPCAPPYCSPVPSMQK